ncbi:MAG: DUF3106 domain-containing protein [Burkholderiales bacterium]
MVKKIYRVIILIGLCVATSAWSADRNGPTWSALKKEQQLVLSSLESEWGNFDAQRKAKWISIANQYPKMGKDEQERIQRRMKTWASLTPEQRQVARENYRDLSRLPQAERHAVRQKWDEYRRLPEDERRQFAPEGSAVSN